MAETYGFGKSYALPQIIIEEERSFHLNFLMLVDVALLQLNGNGVSTSESGHHCLKF